MTFLPSVIRADYCGQFRVHLTFNDLSEKTVDFRRWLEGPVFENLKDQKYFRQFFVDGGTVAWPNGADIAPETLYEAAESERSRAKRPQRAGAKPRVRQRATRAGRKQLAVHRKYER